MDGAVYLRVAVGAIAPQQIGRGTRRRQAHSAFGITGMEGLQMALLAQKRRACLQQGAMV